MTKRLLLKSLSAILYVLCVNIGKRDLVLRMIQQTAQLLRVVCNSIPIEDFKTEQEIQEIQDFSTTLKDTSHRYRHINQYSR